ncbi:hypothetical protein [Serratia ureilytica]|uniref:hypothetical protein n=1 Tax=Serratia ureilytica TaxID=300181 RepID=UPI001E449FC9|nr:hypothetical protein [Serratia ureilytica]
MTLLNFPDYTEDRFSLHHVSPASVTGESLPAQNLALAAGPGADEMTQWRLAIGQARSL